MLKFAIKNMLIKKAKIILATISILVSAAVALVAYNVSRQVEDGLGNDVESFSYAIGNSNTSSTDLTLDTMFFKKVIKTTIPYEAYLDIVNNYGVKYVAPITMGDYYKNAKVIGTNPTLFRGKKVESGRMFTDGGTYEAVLGADVAEQYGLKLGDKLVTGHQNAMGAFEDHDDSVTPLTVVGILEKTYTAYDKNIFTTVQTSWASHAGHDHGSEEDTDGRHEGEALPDSHADDKHVEEEIHEHMICAILLTGVKSSDAAEAYRKEAGFTVANIQEEMVLYKEDFGDNSEIIYLLCAIILAMNIVIISVITLLNMYDSKKEIALMRLIGVGMNKINLLYIIQNGIVGLISTALAFGTSRLCLMLMSNVVMEREGIVLRTGKIYPLEIIIMALVFMISVLPTVICTLGMSRKDGISE